MIVTSYVFKEGKIRLDLLLELCGKIGKEHLVLDLSCRKKDGSYYIVTDRWQNFTDQKITEQLLDELAAYCDEFLLSDYTQRPVTYAGGVGSFSDLEKLKKLGKNRLNVTIGSALDLFGGSMEYQKVIRYIDSM